MHKPNKFISTATMKIYDQVEPSEYGRAHIIKIFDYDQSEILVAAENGDEFRKWVDALKDVIDLQQELEAESKRLNSAS